jgi:DNA-binding CsgD family transcriptional regulator
MSDEFSVFITIPGTARHWLRSFDRAALVGRSEDCDIPLPHPLVSRHHVQLSRTAHGELVARDLGSTNGTIAENSVLRDAEIRARDQLFVHIGPYSLVVSIDSQPDASTLPSPESPDLGVDARALDRAVQAVSRTPPPDELTGREVEVLQLIAAVGINAEIADELSISEHTVVSHISHIFTKTGVANRAQAAAYAVRHGYAR